MSKLDKVIPRMKELRAVARTHGYEGLYDELVDSWISNGSTEGLTTSSTVTTESKSKESFEHGIMNTLNQLATTVADLAASASRLTLASTSTTSARPVRAEPLEHRADQPEPPAASSSSNPPREMRDLFQGETPDNPWQNERYNSDNKLWQAAAMRKRQHYRRSNVSLGVCTIGISGPHEASPRPGKQINRDMVSYFLVLITRPDHPPSRRQAEMQTEGEPPDENAPPDHHEGAEAPLEAENSELPRPLIYAALLGAKSEATEAIKGLLAKVNDDHASLPHTLYFRLHSDRGTEFDNKELDHYCRLHALHRITYHAGT